MAFPVSLKAFSDSDLAKLSEEFQSIRDAENYKADDHDWFLNYCDDLLLHERNGRGGYAQPAPPPRLDLDNATTSQLLATLIPLYKWQKDKARDDDAVFHFVADLALPLGRECIKRGEGEELKRIQMGYLGGRIESYWEGQR